MKFTRKPLIISSIIIIILAYAEPPSGIWAQTPSSGQKLSPASKHADAKLAAPAADRQELQQLKQLVEGQEQQLSQQSQQIDQLKSEVQQLLDATTQASAAAQKAQSGLVEAQTTAAHAQQAAAEAQRSSDAASSNAVEVKTALAAVDAKTNDENRQLSSLEALAGRFRFSGDVRVRGESYMQSTVPDRD